MNLIPDIMEKLGVKEKEVFNIQDKNAHDINRWIDCCHQPVSYRFIKDYMEKDNHGWERDDKTLVGLINGEYTIVKLPFKPEKWEIYWHVTWCNGDNPITDCDKYLGMIS